MTEGPTNSDATDEDLWHRYHSGDPRAFTQLHDRFAPRLLAFLSGKCRPPLDAADVLQQTVLKAIRAREGFVSGSLMSWLITIAKRVLIDMQQKRREVQTADESPWDVPETPQLDPLQDERMAALKDCLQALGGDFVQVLRWRLAGREDLDIANEMQIEIATVYSRANRGTKQLQECVEKKLS